MTMAAGFASMTLMTPEAYDRLAELGRRLVKGIISVIGEARAGMQIVGYGSIFRLHMNQRDLVDYRSSHMTADEVARMSDLSRRLFAKGFILGGNGSLALSTAMRDADIDSVVVALGEAIREQARAAA